MVNILVRKQVRLLKYGKHFGKKTSKILSGKYSQKLLDHAIKFVTDVLKN